MPSRMLHHVSFAVADLDRSASFYDNALKTLGYVRIWTAADAIGYAPPGSDDLFALKRRSSKVTAPGEGFHLAFSAPSNGAVDAFHAAALGHGGIDGGAPGLRPQYGPRYYAAFVIDPDGYRIEAVHKHD